ncbi:DUF4055 domain-containing protein [Escherichia coli]|uniref:DUF4055 domain-containing protein n=1 Tax=Escherichia coli TaxID=562 RepID=UPI0013B39FCC|nr:DUF4055 domain-containing protein [Escherichia coli]
MSKINTPTNAYMRMAERWHLPHALYDGQKALQSNAVKFLPQFEGESSYNYAVRLKASYLFNVYKKTIDGAVGKVFSKPSSVNDAHKKIVEWIEDIDLQGNHLDVFNRGVFHNGLNSGIGHIFVDVTSAPDLGREATLADQEELGLRPYFVNVPPQNVIEQRFQQIKGRLTLTRVRIKEDADEAGEDFVERRVERIRVLEIGKWSLWEKFGPDDWRVIDGNTTPLTYIPFVNFYTNQTGPGEAVPPLENLANTNLRHYQSSTDQINILRIARVPILHISGMDDIGGEGSQKKQDVVVGPNSVIKTGIDDKVGWVEHSGAAINSGRDDLANLEKQMQEQSMALTARSTSGDVTATEAVGNHLEAHCILQSYAHTYRDALELALSYMADLGGLGKENGGTVIINTDFSVPFDKSLKLQHLISIRASGDISRETFLREIQSTGFFSEDFDVEVEIEKVENEVPVLTGEPMDITNSLETSTAKVPTMELNK